MAYCPIGQGGALLAEPALQQVARRHGVTTAQVALAWLLRQEGVLVIPKAVHPEHVQLNAQACELQLQAEDLQTLDLAFPAPRRKQHLEMV